MDPKISSEIRISVSLLTPDLHFLDPFYYLYEPGTGCPSQDFEGGKKAARKVPKTSSVHIKSNRTTVWPKPGSKGKYAAKFTSTRRNIWEHNDNEYVKIKVDNSFKFIKI